MICMQNIGVVEKNLAYILWDPEVGCYILCLAINFTRWICGFVKHK